MSEEKATHVAHGPPWAKITMHNPSSSLAYLLDPIDEAVFFRDYWGKRTFVRTGNDRHRMDGLFDLEDLEEYLFIAKPQLGDVDFHRHGEAPPGQQLLGLGASNYSLQTLYSAFGAGYTVMLHRVHERWSAVRRLADALETRLLSPVDTAVFVAGPNTSGLRPHTDSSNVFVFQTVGSKHWVVDEDAQGTSRREFELHAGDMLYMPNGVVHEAKTTSEMSIHVSFAMRSLTWKTLATRCLQFMAAQNPEWNEIVANRVLQSANGPAMIAEMLERFRKGLSNVHDIASVLEGYREMIEAGSTRANPPPSNYANSLIQLDGLNVATEVERRPGVGCHVTTDETSAMIQFMGDTLHCPRSTTDALRFVAATPRFRVGQIDDDLPDASKVVLVRRLIREGLLQCAASAN